MNRAHAVTSSPGSSGWKHTLLWLASWVSLGVGISAALAGGYALFTLIRSAPDNQVLVSGNLAPQQLAQLRRVVSQVNNTSYFTADLASIRDRVLMLSWVDRVTIRRHWPEGLSLQVIPRHPVARWGSGRLLSDRGDIFVEAAPQEHASLPLLHGPVQFSRQMMQQYHQVNQWFMPLGLRLNQLHLTERMTWYFEFDNGLRLIVDQHQPQTKLQKLSQLAVTDLAPVWKRIQRIDLRYQNGMAIEWKPGLKPGINHGQFAVAPESAVPVPLVAEAERTKD